MIPTGRQIRECRALIGLSQADLAEAAGIWLAVLVRAELAAHMPMLTRRDSAAIQEALEESEARRVSLVALNGMTFDLATPHGRMMATLLAGIAEFERELTVERIRSGIAAAKARGARLGRQLGESPESDRLVPKVLALVEQGRNYRLIGREIGLSKNTVAAIVKRHRLPPPTGELRS